MEHHKTTAPRVALLLSDGFEDAEAVIFIDILRRLNIHVDVLSCMETRELATYFNTRITADDTLANCFDDNYDAIAMVGGPKNTDNMTVNEMAISFIKRHIELDKWICALCSAPAKVLSKHGLLEGREYSTGDNLISAFPDGKYVDKKIVVADKFITGKGLGVAFEFTFTVAEKLLPDSIEKVDNQANHIYFEYWKNKKPQ
ncbi:MULTISPECIES: DJ-1/PfpI family protein [Vibrio]|uniref:DJ-1/PfpI family protein n=1 Tax=Vibrio navarrensis TaxID=29495 RepID=A0AAJ4IGU6_9VIBR|nr:MULTISPECIES: DJ-1/PfpI family protein [Vibrio]KJR38593.1 thiamine biosynthesis protein ThiJ [Vibrio sp. S234-5]MBE3662894.1 DJ-1 family protein [Vibrio navarrensis]MBE3671077.1 DJ-1 family protein [Vibrio navarrensis]MBE4594444.1 DJ-1 family protein [Vibrio navarrensis]QPL56583.1 DJ-1/PfpI family protein [Vibrio navarrensis]